MPGLIDLYEAHKKDREKFEILAFHDGTVKDFAELDPKMEAPRKRFWGGHDLPFPILLDATGQTIKDWGVRAFPTTVLIDPEGKLVGQAGEEELEKKLPPLPMSVRVARTLDRNLPAIAWEKITLEGSAKALTHYSGLPIRLDQKSLKAAGVATDALLPLEMTTSISLRSTLNLILEAYNVTYNQDEKGLVITARQSGAAPARLSDRQRAAVKRMEKALDQKVSFNFKSKPLAEVTRFLDSHIQDETVILSPRDRQAGLLDPKMPISGTAKDMPFREALKKLLGPLGIGYELRDEVIVLTAKPKTTK